MHITDVDIRHFKDVLSNGMTVVTIEMPHIHTVEVGMFIRSGLRFETGQNNGISHFLEHMMFRGNKRYPDSVSLNIEFEKIGRDLRASTLTEYTFYGFSPHVSQMERGIELFAEFFTDPSFPGLELERQIILEEYLEEINEAGENIDINNHACNLLYKGTPLAMPTIGAEKTIKSITVEMLREYFQTYYIPRNMVLVCAGCVSREQLPALVEKNFSRLHTGGKVIGRDYFKKVPMERPNGPGFAFQYDLDSQIQLQVCFRSFSYNSPEYYGVYLTNRILDDGVASRLQVALREKLGLVYAIESRITSLSDVGTFDFDVTVSPEKILEVTRVLLREIADYVRSGPTEEDLAHVKKRYLYDLDFDLDDPYKQILRYGFVQLYSEEVTVDKEKTIIEAVTVQELHTLARKIFTRENLNLICVGPFTLELKTEMEKLVSEF